MTHLDLEFHPNNSQPVITGAEGARIRAGIRDKLALMIAISSQLRFPGSFGHNWDALDECLADLDWLDSPQIIIWHDDIPLLNMPSEASKYVGVLRNVVRENRRLRVSFPEHTRGRVSELAAQTGD